MTSEEVQKKIQELEALRSQARYWRLGITAAIVLITVVCVGSLVNSVHSLFRPGPAQDEFTSTLTADLKQNTLPQVQSIAGQALTESKPEIEASFTKLNTRVPELTSASLKQLTMLQHNLPERGDKVLNATYGTLLKKHEAKIRALFPEATDANVAALVDTMSAEGQTQIVSANNTLFSKHQAALTGIQNDLATIQNTETVTADEDQSNWEMALLVVDSFHDDLQGLQAEGAKPAAAPKIGKDVKK